MQFSGDSEHIVGLGRISREKESDSPYRDAGPLRTAIREAVGSASGKEAPENPFAGIVGPGMTVLLKPNWVLHYNRSGAGMDCMITTPGFIGAVIRELAGARPGKIIIGDAPIQSTVFPEIVTPEVADLFRQAAGGIDLEIRDFRSEICIPGSVRLTTTRNPDRAPGGILYDLGTDSLVEPISDQSAMFRNTSYNPRTLRERHRRGRHQYLLAPEIAEADIIINLPKLKTHRKAGITAALKNIVGLNANKDYLPHHRKGGSRSGGDCYEGRSLAKGMAEYCLDQANLRINSPGEVPWRLGTSWLLKARRCISGEDELEGSWYGNDTLWRTVLDLNRILVYGTGDGGMADSPQRVIYSLTDGVVAGENLGPLAPTPKYVGYVTFARSSPYADLIHSSLMHFDWRRIPMVSHSFDRFRFPLTDGSSDRAVLAFRGEEYPAEEAAGVFGMDFSPPPGWKGHIESGNMPPG